MKHSDDDFISFLCNQMDSMKNLLNKKKDNVGMEFGRIKRENRKIGLNDVVTCNVD
jgi:hypothetical protein